MYLGWGGGGGGGLVRECYGHFGDPAGFYGFFESPNLFSFVQFQSFHGPDQHS